MRFVYRVLSYLLVPVAVLFFIWRGLRNPAYFDRIWERFGFIKTRMKQASLWVHAVSVGEVQAASALISALLDDYPESPVVVTTVTPTGADRVKALFGDRVTHVYAPWDLPGCVSRFFNRTHPRIAIIMETELWPNLYNECGSRGVPLVLANARISPRSVPKYRRFVTLFRETLSHGIVIAAQSEKDAERFRMIGAVPERTHVTGNIKFDFHLPPEVEEEGRQLRVRNAADRPVWIAASTHEGEERILLDVAASVRRRHPDALLILVPRHPERFDGVAEMIERRRERFVTRSSRTAVSSDDCIVLVDTLGELPMFYHAADVAFIGGSLVPIGGHNLLEAAVAGIPILTGPFLFNTEEIAEMLQEVGAASVVENGEALSTRIRAYFEDDEKRREDGAAGLATVEENRGTLERLLALVRPLIEGGLPGSS